MIKNLIEKAWDIENKSIMSYMGWLKILTNIGINNKQILNFIVDIIEDSLIHKRLVEALAGGLNDIDAIKEELYKLKIRASSKENTCDNELIEFIKNMIREHDIIEKDAAKIYRKLASLVDSDIARRVFELIAEDETKHDEYMKKLDTLVDELCS